MALSAPVNITTATSASVTIPATTAGNTLIVAINSYAFTGKGSVSGITLGGSASGWSEVVAAHEASGADYQDAFIWVCTDIAGGQTSVLISGTNLNVASSDGGVTVYEVHGLAAASIVDQTSPGTGTTTAWSSGTTAATSQPDEFCVATACGYNALTLPGSPWVSVAQDSNDYGISAYQILSAAGTVTFAGTQGSAGAWAAAVATFKAASTATTASGALAAGAPGLTGDGSNGSGPAPDGSRGSIGTGVPAISASASVEAPPSLVHTTVANTLTVTIPATTAGNTLVVVVGSMNSAGAATVSGVTLGGSGTGFSQAKATDYDHAGSEWYDAAIWVGKDIAGGQTAVVISGTNLNVALLVTT